MMNSVEVLMSNTGSQLEVIGDPVRAAGWYNLRNKTTTIQVVTNAFIGRVYIEASIANDPSEEDWFPIYLNGLINYLEFPRNEYPIQGYGESATVSFSFSGNFLWIRARMDRANLGYDPDHQQLQQMGSVDRILMS